MPNADLRLLRERDQEIEAVADALNQAEQGEGALLLFGGPAGIGKTSLLREAERLARDRGLLVLSATAGEIEKNIPFGVARQLFETVVERSPSEDREALLAGAAHLSLLGLERGAVPSDASADSFAPVHGLYWLTANVADRGPLLIRVDDLQWCDPETLRYVDYLSRRLEGLRVLFIGAARTGEPDEPDELQRLKGTANYIEPKPLTAGAIEEIVLAGSGTRPTKEFSKACATATKGNPFLVFEVVRALIGEQLAPDDETARTIGRFARRNVANRVLVRLGRYGKSAVSLARAVSILGEAARLKDAAALAGLAEPESHLLCDRLREAGIFSPGSPIQFVHPLVRQAVYMEQSEGERSAKHRMAAELLHARGVDAQEIAPHLIGCAPEGDPWVVERLREAARHARSEGAHDRARLYLERALAEPPIDDFEDRYWLARAFHNIDPGRAVGVFVELAERVPENHNLRLDALRWAAASSFTSGDIGGALERSIDALGAVPESDREARLLLEAQVFVFGLTHSGRDQRARERIESIAEGLEGATDAELVVRQAVAVGWFFESRPVEEVIEWASRFPSVWEIDGIRILVSTFASKILTHCGRWDRSRAAMSQLVEQTHATGQVHAEAWGHGFLAEIERSAGRFKDAEAEANLAIEMAEALGPFSLSALYAKFNLLATLIATGQLDRAQTLANELPMEFGPREIRMLSPWPLEVRGYLRLAQGDLAAGVEDLIAFGAACEDVDFDNPAVSSWHHEAAAALVALGRTDEAKELLDRAEERARRFGAPHVMGALLRSRALLETSATQIEALERSVALLESSGPPHELARSWVELGIALRRRGSRIEARGPLATGLDVAHRCGAEGLAARARDELIAVGARPRRRAVTGPESLTASEYRVAWLAAEGLSNRAIAQRLFVTLRTVETHLTHVYDKLQIPGREGLRAALAD